MIPYSKFKVGVMFPYLVNKVEIPFIFSVAKEEEADRWSTCVHLCVLDDLGC